MKNIEILEHSGSRFLWIDGYLWMWDTEQEKALQKELAEKAFGDVLVAGYGFGILPKYLVDNPKVKAIITVELYPEVVDRMKQLDGKIFGEIIIGDFYNFPEERKHDCIVGDIWPDITAKFLDDYKKFKEKAMKLLKPDGIILAWGQDYFEYLIEKQLK